MKLVYKAPVNPNVVFESLEDQRKNGTLSERVTNAAFRYQISVKQPGYLERIDRQGHITTGRFVDGHFIPLDKEID